MNDSPSYNFKVNVKHSHYPGRVWTELKLHSTMTLDTLKNLLHYRTGTPADQMRLYAYNEADPQQCFALQDDDSKTLFEVGLKQGYQLMLFDDRNPLFSADEEKDNASQRKLFRLSEEDYEKRPDNARKFLKSIRALQGHTTERVFDSPNMKRGDRCEVLCLGGVRGEILSVGPRTHYPGLWIRIRLDEPLGTHQVPECDDGYGYYISTYNWEKKLLVGDYPPMDLLDSV